MANKMLIDASHREETRVVVLRGNRIEEFDFESEARKQLRGNIYLARVTRVEPSLQAAFVEYGGNRHGFLAFSEIHPDYYQIPTADRQALLAEEAEEARQQDAEDDEKSKEKPSSRKGRGRRRGKASKAADAETEQNAEAAAAEGGEDEPQVMAAELVGDFVTEEIENGDEAERDDERNGDNGDDEANGDDDVESVGAEDALEEVPDRRRSQRRQYRIQEVIKRRQILLVQVVKEERGNKGAALTTYLSLAGRYSVLMPNTARGGGISRKITQLQDRKRLKDVVRSLEVPQGMGVILRTAGANRTKAEIKRDYEYLMRLWENVRNLTLQSTAPCLVYEEGSLIKRAIRDLYNKDIGEVQVSGEDGYREAKDFMRMLMPSHAKAVQPYRDTLPIFARNGIEAQLDKMLQPQVTLKSGGYIIINQTEALVSIDVNSGRSTREHSIEDTALQTNLEAAEEVARQLRLRDLAGLIVIDFIDMDEKRNNRSVEKRLKDCLKQDRARIQVGRISHFGLLEMSRQRIRASVLESTMKTCPHCGGTGMVRSDSSEALHVIRSIEEHLLKSSSHDIVVRTSTHTALYILNHKRTNIQELEQRFGLTITMEADESLGHVHYAIDRGDPASGVPAPAGEAVQIDHQDMDEPDDIAADAEEDADRDASEDGDNGRRKRRRRRRRRGGGGDDDGFARDAADGGDAREAREDGEGDSRRRRRRGKRGGRRNRREPMIPRAELVGWTEDELQALAEQEAARKAEAEAQEKADNDVPADAPTAEDAATPDAGEEAAPRSRRPRRRKAPEAQEAAPDDDAVSEPVAAAEAEAEAETVDADVVAEDAGDTADTDAGDDTPEADAPENGSVPSEPVVTTIDIGADASEPAVEPSGGEPEKRKRTGWWQKRSFF